MNVDNLKIRNALEADLEDVLHVERTAFGSEEEADLVRNLLVDPTAKPLLSLLAFDGDKPVGHILFTKAGVGGADVKTMLLAPLAVVPDAQKMGVGKALIKRGLEDAKEKGVELVFVLGHPDYYPRSGFTPAGQHGLEAPYPIPEKDAGAWMVIELCPGLIGRVRGQVKCAKAIDAPEYWRE